MPINKVDSKGIEDGSIATADLADGIVTSAKLENNAVTNAKLSNSSITLFGTSISLGSSATFTNRFVNWQTVKTSGFTAVAGEGYFCNTTSAAFTVILPTSATRGDTIAIKDYAGTFGTNNLTINRSVHNIQGVASNSLISTNRASVVLVYVDSTRGWEFVEESNVAVLVSTYISATGGTITTSGNFKIHTFTGDDSFVVDTVGNPAGGGSNVDYLVIAGGGGGGRADDAGGGGGAGGYRTSGYGPAPLQGSALTLTSGTSYPITIGGGGSGAPNSSGSGKGTSGSASIFSTITSTGGGAGGGGTTSGGGVSPSACRSGQNGGSGGGSATCMAPIGYPGANSGIGNTPPVSPPQGNNGGTSVFAGVPPIGVGGGGGATGVGGNGGAPAAGAGGAGAPNNISGCSVTYAGGGGGGAQGSATLGSGGSGGGGAGATPSVVAVSGTVNTGGGGGGASASSGGGSGGKGIVVIRYQFQ